MMSTISRWDELSFQNLSESHLSMNDVLERIIRFIGQDPKCAYQFVIGTDSQVHRGHTKFVTGIVIHRIGRGAWACYRQVAVPRQLNSIREKLTLETSFSQRVAGYFDSSVLGQMEDLLLPYVYQGATLETYIDIDAGTEPVVNQTALYVQEMMDRVESMGLYAPRVKPDAYVASSYANRFTKNRMVL
ncbi:ribonuclease H-like YkuK family protein [Cohnella mopanensis]|uniref:ribonuclease H-like YkuK family protein n=1 Tax=Cohnella mopanensis TaxID=2911966 RepID=UPI003F6E562A